MSKRILHPAYFPAAKRLHTSPGPGIIPTTRQLDLSFDSLYDELILYIFSYLSSADLCAVQATSRNWYRLAADNELWRILYLKVFGRSRLRGSKGFVARPDGREVRPLPERANSKQEDMKDWKWMFRISSNWRNGRCMIEQPNQDLPSSALGSNDPYRKHVLLAGPLTIIASSEPSNLPVIEIYSPFTNPHNLTCESQFRGARSEITALAIDQSPPLLGNLRLASFMSTGEFIIFSLNPIHLPTASRQYMHVPSLGNARSSPIIQAVYHHPLLITLSQNFKLSIYDLSDGAVKHTQTLSSFTSFPPTSLVLSTPTSTTYKLVLAYTIPVYPAHWTIGATELIISGSAASSGHPPPQSLSSQLPPIGQMRVISTRTTRALDVPRGWIDEDKLRIMHEQWSRKVSKVAETQTDGKWVVLAPAEEVPTSAITSGVSFLNSSTTLQLYRLHLPPPSSSVAASPPKLTFVRSLYGQTGPISSLALSDGRCVSLSLNGSLWVWDLEAGLGTEVAEPSFGGIAGGDPAKGAVAFDERRIVSTEERRVVIRRFDI